MKKIKMKGGLDVPLHGSVRNNNLDTIDPQFSAVIAEDYFGLKPKILVKEGYSFKKPLIIYNLTSNKISSKNTLLKLENGKFKIFKDLEIKSIKCKNSEFDDNPEITAYIQVRDLTNKNNDEVFIFNGWMFSSSPSIEPFDHPVYDVWLVSCY